MTQLVLDDQLAASEVLRPLRRWMTAQRLRDLRPDERIHDDRVPEILLTLRQPTFVTIDQGFWDRRLCNPGYCILYFGLSDAQQHLIPRLLRQLFLTPEFRTRTKRMGKVTRITSKRIEYWQFPAARLHRLHWRTRPREE